MGVWFMIGYFTRRLHTGGKYSSFGIEIAV